MKKKYKVKAKFTFEGEFEVIADTAGEAHKIVADDCHLVLGGNIHTDNELSVNDWDFDMHPVKTVGRPKRKNKKKRWKPN